MMSFSSQKQPHYPQALSTFICTALFGCGFAFAVSMQGGCNQVTQSVGSENELVDRTVEVACGECQLELPGNGCDLAIRVDGKAYFVDGSSIDDHGDAHAADGLCNTIRKAKVTGTIQNDRFQSKKIELIKE